jgi:hypothetical protein
LLVDVNSESLGIRAIVLLKLDDIAILKVAADEIGSSEVSCISNDDRVE